MRLTRQQRAIGVILALYMLFGIGVLCEMIVSGANVHLILVPAFGLLTGIIITADFIYRVWSSRDRDA